MKYIQLQAITTRQGSEPVADLMAGMANFAGVSIYDPEDLKDVAKGPAKYDYADEKLTAALGSPVKVCGFFGPWSGRREEGAETVRAFDALAGVFKENAARVDGFDPGPLTASWELIDDADWADVWKKYYKPQKIGGIAVVPCWEDIGRYDKGKFIVLDPGAAFGTGEHETTRSCIRLMLLLRRAGRMTGKTFIDLGCGSGILGLTAALFGCGNVTMIDLDPVAVSAAGNNLKLNLQYYPDFDSRAEVIEGDLFEHADIKADVIAANISSDILIANAERIAAHLNAGGHLILSGIIHSRADEVFTTYSDLGFHFKKHIVKGEWNAALLSRG
ncbi:ribosomal protein L11 methyltransferase [Clostridia bacterium]|nr:ribosomal protein L11 methyltransferase [Clostridia bacterium]